MDVVFKAPYQSEIEQLRISSPLDQERQEAYDDLEARAEIRSLLGIGEPNILERIEAEAYAFLMHNGHGPTQMLVPYTYRRALLQEMNRLLVSGTTPVTLAPHQLRIHTPAGSVEIIFIQANQIQAR